MNQTDCTQPDLPIYAYVDVKLQEGLETAGQQFPEIALHLKECTECREEVVDLENLYTMEWVESSYTPQFDFWFLRRRTGRGVLEFLKRILGGKPAKGGKSCGNSCRIQS